MDPSTAPPPSSSSSKPLAPPKPDKFAGYTTAADLGYLDPELLEVPEVVDRAAEEAAAQAKLEGRAGQWSFVAAPTPPPPEPEAAEDGKRPALGAYAGLSVATRGDHDDDAKENREFKFVRKEKRPINWGANDDDDGEIKVKVKEKEEGLMAKKRKKEDDDAEAAKLVWKPVAWGSKIGAGGASAEQPTEGQEDVKLEEDAVPAVKQEVEEPAVEETKPEVDAPPPAPAAPMFKKRRGAPAGVGKKPKF